LIWGLVKTNACLNKTEKIVCKLDDNIILLLSASMSDLTYPERAMGSISGSVGASPEALRLKAQTA